MFRCCQTAQFAQLLFVLAESFSAFSKEEQTETELELSKTSTTEFGEDGKDEEKIRKSDLFSLEKKVDKKLDVKIEMYLRKQPDRLA